MRKTRFIFNLIILVLVLNIGLIFKTNAQLLPPNDPAYQLAWADSFNSPQLNDEKWLKRYPWHQASNYNYNFCDSTGWVVPVAAVKVWDAYGNPDTTNCKINNGSLKLYTKKENYQGIVWNWPRCSSDSCIGYPCDSSYDPPRCFQNNLTLPFKFTTAMLYSKYDFRYGYFEMKFKLPPFYKLHTYQGNGSGFWLWNGDSATYSEIDGPEINSWDWGTHKYYYATGNSHYSRNVNLVDPNSDFFVYKDTNFTANTWHTSAINWTSTAIEYYYDGVLQYVSHNHPDSLRPMAIIINLGGCYAPVDNYCEPFDTSSTGTYFPYVYEVDYIKVWQLKKDNPPNCTTAINLTSFNPSTYPNQLHKSITMGTNVSITNQSNQSFWGDDYILLNNLTYIDGNSNVLFNVTNCSNIGYSKNRSSTTTTAMPATFNYRMQHHF